MGAQAVKVGLENESRYIRGRVAAVMGFFQYEGKKTFAHIM
jgi:hypothetical protein